MCVSSLCLSFGTVESIHNVLVKQNRILRYSVYTVQSFQRVKIFNVYSKVLSKTQAISISLRENFNM